MKIKLIISPLENISEIGSLIDDKDTIEQYFESDDVFLFEDKETGDRLKLTLSEINSLHDYYLLRNEIKYVILQIGKS